MIAVVLPAASASRTSIHVISSIQTVFAAGSGFGVSAQLYSFAAHCPPPMFRGSGGGRWKFPRPPPPGAPARCGRAGGGVVPPCAIAWRMKPAVCSARKSTISRAHSRFCTRSAIETPLIVVLPAATRSSYRTEYGSFANMLSVMIGSSCRPSCAVCSGKPRYSMYRPTDP